MVFKVCYLKFVLVTVLLSVSMPLSVKALSTRYQNLAQIQTGENLKVKARRLDRQGLTIAKQVDDRRHKAITLNKIGAVYRRLGQYDKALQYHEQALAIHKQLGDRPGEGRIFNNIGLVHSDQRNYAKALEYYEQALGIYKQLGDQGGEENTPLLRT